MLYESMVNHGVDIIVIGGGPAGMIAAGVAAESGAKITLLEKNQKLGKKLYITGKGRCNVTNDTDIRGLLSHTVRNPKFLQSAFNALDAQKLMTLIESMGTPLKTERGGRVFPISDKAADITDALVRYMRNGKVKIALDTTVTNITANECADGHFTTAQHSTCPKTCKSAKKCFGAGEDSYEHIAGQVCTKRFTIRTQDKTYHASAVIIATGGLSYPSTGSTGDGYFFAKNFGHTVSPTSPSLVPIICAEAWVSDVKGLSLKNVKCTLRKTSTASNGKRKSSIVFEEMGEMLFTPTGITGPLVLTASAHLAGILEYKQSKTGLPEVASINDQCNCGMPKMQPNTSNTVNTDVPILTSEHDYNYKIEIDLKPALSHEQLDARILRDFAEGQNKNFANALDSLLPQRLIHTIINLSDIPPGKKVNNITKQERQKLVSLLKCLALTPVKTAGFSEAVITRGGVLAGEVNPSTMMSKHCEGLFFAGELLDVDALTGGYNLQIAFSTGYLAGKSAAIYIRSLV